MEQTMERATRRTTAMTLECGGDIRVRSAVTVGEQERIMSLAAHSDQTTTTAGAAKAFRATATIARWAIVEGDGLLDPDGQSIDFERAPDPDHPSLGAIARAEVMDAVQVEELNRIVAFAMSGKTEEERGN